MASDKYIIITKEKKKNNFICWIFSGILFFITIYFPFFGSNLRYKTGSFFSSIFNAVGIFCVTMGAVILVWGFIILFCTRSFKAISIMLLGFFLIVMGSFWLEPGTFGIITHGREVPKGYY